jgi:hypothetical protein
MVPPPQSSETQLGSAEDDPARVSLSDAAFPGWGREKPEDIQGQVDLIDGERVAGWAYDAASPGRRLLIQVSSGNIVEVTVANIERQDLIDAGKGDGRHGFEVRFNTTSNLSDLVHIKVVATGLDLPGSPAQVDMIGLIAHESQEKVLECLKSEALLALLALKGIKKQ